MEFLKMEMFLSLLLLSLGGMWPRAMGTWAGSRDLPPGFEDYQLMVQSRVTVQEGLCILVPCSFSYPEDREGRDYFPVYGYWFREGANTNMEDPVASSNPDRPAEASTQGRFQLVGNPGRNNCTLVIRDTQREDTMSYFFRVEKGMVKFNFVSKKFWLEVTALTQKPDIFIPEVLESGQAVTVLCVVPWVSERCSAPSISWSGPALSSSGSRPHPSFQSVLYLTPRPGDHNTQLTCRVDFRARVSTQRAIRLSVAYPPRDPVITIFRDNAPESQGNTMYVDAQKGQFLQLLCTADGRPPPTLTWVMGNRVLSRSNVTGPESLGLDLSGVKAGDAGRYTCHAENRLGSRHRALDLSVQYPPEELRVTAAQGNTTELEIRRNGSSLLVLQGQSLRLVCVTHSNPPATLSWARGSQTLSPRWPTDPGVLELPVVQVEHEGEFTCRAQNPLGTLHISLGLSVHYEGSISAAFSKGACLGIGATSLLSLCIIVVIMKTLRKSQPRTETSRAQVSRSSILDYINVAPMAGALMQNRKAKPSNPPRTPSPGTGSPEPRKNQKTPISCPELKSSTQSPDLENSPEELHYAALNFRRPLEAPRPRDPEEIYTEIHFHKGSPRL
ncbi:sialic acid-binding Ig-like lectin 10 [Perognathus longimembris pacificus]|uniref:sialic acid-binding Ig-like lectin 10 n=1 Tax=Perognathus longimembris pacificus TaxID=214514 RepID=UPI002019C0D7|nr:sialic acid-binding Ig-like lectin 10 [Perognathus longimembris pacificus]